MNNQEKEQSKKTEGSSDISVKDFVLRLVSAFEGEVFDYKRDRVKLHYERDRANCNYNGDRVNCTESENSSNFWDFVIENGRLQGWMEEEDQRFAGKTLMRRTAARISHSFMKIVLQIPDAEDISSAEILRDLYTCRVCTNHIAQIFVRGIMEGREIEHEGQMLQIFDHLATVSEQEADVIIQKIKENANKLTKEII